MNNKLFFTFTEGMSVKKILRLKDYVGDFGEIAGLKRDALAKCGFLSENDIQKIEKVKKEVDIKRQLNIMMDKNIKVTFYGEDNYPTRLYDIANPPWGLYYINELPGDDLPVVSIIGARSCSEYGKSCAKYFAGELAKNGVQVVSGMASGIDGIAQRQAIVNGKSFGILGSGVDVCYPQSNRDLYQELSVKGGIISEYPLGTKPEAYRFPMRNRIISGLSDIVLVIEAKEKSGTSITVNMALEQGRDVFAVPGRINDRLSDGCNQLIRDGAGMAITVTDLLDELSTMSSCNIIESRALKIKDNIKKNSINISLGKEKTERTCDIRNLDLDTTAILKLINEGHMNIDELYQVGANGVFCEISNARELSVKLVEMELGGLIKEQNGCYQLN